MFEVQALYKGETTPVVLRTDDIDRAKLFATTLRGNDRYTQVAVIIGNERLTHEEFIHRLETTSAR